MRIKKRIAALLMAGAMICSTLPVNALAMENSNQEKIGSPTRQECVCTTLCTTEMLNEGCELCGAEGFGICMGKEADEQVDTLPSVEDAMPDEEQQVCEALQARASTDGVKYLDENGDEQTADNVTVVESSMTAWNDGWYVVNSTVTINSRVTVSGKVHLILADNASLIVNGGINVAESNSFSVYAQSVGENMGTLTATSSQFGEAGIGGKSGSSGGKITICGGSIEAASRKNGAGIGGGADGSGGTITIHGGSVNATGGNVAAGIGGGSNGSGGTITIHGGSVNATGGGSGAGIGGGFNRSGGNITISGGNVNATGGEDAAGIGGGMSGSGGIITISGGTVNATGGRNAAGIGGGFNSSGGNITIHGGNVTATGGWRGAGIGGGNTGSGGIVTIDGGTVTATGKDDAAGIGGGISGSDGSFATGTGGHALIFADGGISDKTSQSSWSGIIFDGNTGKVYGDQTLQENLEIPSGKTLTVPENTTLTVNRGVTLTNSGTITGGGALGGEGNLVGSGTVAKTITNHLKKTVRAIQISKQPNKLSYTSGQKLDLNGLSVQVDYNDNTNETIFWESGKLTAEPAQETVLTVANHNGKTITISYGGQTAQTDVLTVGKAEQTALSITSAPEKIYKGSSFTLQTSGGSGEGAVTWSVVSGSATVDANGTVTVTDTGEFQIKAVKAEDGEYNQTEALITLTAVKKSSGSGGSSGSGSSGGSSGSSGSSGGGSSGGSSGSSGSSGGGSSGGSSSDNGGSGGSTIVDRPTSGNPNTPTTGQTTPVKPTTNGNANINGSTVQQAIDKAAADAKKNGNTANGIAVVVPVKMDAKLKNVQITLKADTLDKLVSSNVKRFTIDTDRMADFDFTLDTLKELNRQTSGDIVLKVKKTTVSSAEAKTAIGTRPAYDISLWEVKNGKETQITDLNGKTVSIAIPYTPTKNEQAGNLYAVSVDAAGKVQRITKSSYDAERKTVIFQLTQPGTYGVGYDAKTPAFTDITGHWAKDNILFVVNRGLLNGTGATTFSPNTGMTRGMFMTAIGRLAGINPDSYQSGKFTDVKADTYYAPYINWAAKTGIVSGTTDTIFSPDSNINREEMVVIMKNYTSKLGYTIPKTLEAVTFADNASISSWAEEAVKSMQQAGILAGKTNNRFDPTGTATRAEVTTVLRRFVEIVIDSQTDNGGSKTAAVNGVTIKTESR